MEHLIILYNHFAHIPAERFPHVLLRMAPGFLNGLGVSLIALFIRDTSAGFFTRYLARATRRYEKLSHWLLRVISSINGWFIWTTGIYIAVQSMPYMEPIDRPAQKLYYFFVFLQLGVTASHLLSLWAEDYIGRHRKTDAARVTMVGSMVRVGYMAIWLIVFTMLLRNYGVDISAMIAGLGVGGLAVAFAFQNILKDIFGSFSIVFDKPFVIGDFISAGDFSGTVEAIGTKTTRLRSASGELIVISNNDILSTRIRNFGNMYERRIAFTTRVQYGTPAAKLEKIPAMLTRLASAHSRVRFDRSHFQTYTDFGPQFETVYFVLTPDYNLMMDIQQEINLGIYRYFEKEGIEFAIPTQKNVGTVVTHNELLPAAKPNKPKATPAKRK